MIEITLPIHPAKSQYSYHVVKNLKYDILSSTKISKIMEITFTEAENYIGIRLSVSQEKSLKTIFPIKKTPVFSKHKKFDFFACAPSKSFGKIVKNTFLKGVAFS